MGLEIRSFKGVRYDPDRFGRDWSSLTCPPYDVIDENERDQFLSLSSYNFVQVVLSRPLSESIGLGKDRDYSRVRNLLRTWMETGILKREKKDSIYLYRLRYRIKDATRTRLGFVALLRLPEEDGWVLPHERTHEGPKEDRFDLLDQTQSLLEPIFLLLPDHEEELLRHLESMETMFEGGEFAKEDNCYHEVVAVSDEAWITELRKLVFGRRALIADGHHRFEVSLAYRDYRRSKPDYDPEAWYNYALVYFVPMVERNITILPIHRFVRKFSVSTEEELLARLGDLFSSEVVSIKELERISEGLDDLYAYGLTTSFGAFRIKLKDEWDPCDLLKEMTDTSPEYRRLHVVVLHNVLFPLLGIDQREGNISYEKSLEKVLKVGRSQCGVVVRPTSLDKVYSLALKGERMPQKSTYFYPKIRSGFVFYF